MASAMVTNHWFRALAKLRQCYVVMLQIVRQMVERGVA